MPWRETVLMDQRVQFIADYQRDVFDLAGFARRYGISRKTAYKWLDRDETVGRRAGGSIAAPATESTRHRPCGRHGAPRRATASSDLGLSLIHI